MKKLKQPTQYAMGLFQIPKKIKTIASRCLAILETLQRIENKMTSLNEAVAAVVQSVGDLESGIATQTETLAAEIQQVAAALAAKPDLSAETATLNSVVERLSLLKQKVTDTTSTISGIIADVPPPPEGEGEGEGEVIIVDEDGEIE